MKQATTSSGKIRTLLVVGVVAVLLATGGFILYARLTQQRFLLNLPKRLGVDIKQETNGFTYSQSVGGKTVFTVHAAKEIQRADGKVTLHDVGITLYGRKQDRADRIHGNEFEYDQASGTLRAIGEVYIDLAAPSARPASGSTPTPHVDSDADTADMIHVKTSGLVFLQKERSASTSEALEFTARGFTGQATGVSYNSADGILVLQSAVHVSGLRGQQQVNLTVKHAELDRQKNLANLEGAQYVAITPGGPQTLAAEHVLIHLTPDGEPTALEAQGNVTLDAAAHGHLVSQRLNMTLSEEGHPHEGHLLGNVQFTNDTAQQQRHGAAQEVHVTFDPAGRPLHLVAQHAVSLSETSARGDQTLRAEHLEMNLAGGGKQRLFLRAAQAESPTSVILHMHDAQQGSTTDLRADTLKANFREAAGKSQLSSLDGTGHTQITRQAPDTQDTSRGNTLHADFAPSRTATVTLQNVTQTGDVTIERSGVAKKGATQMQHASADRAAFDAARDTVLLTGNTRLVDAGNTVYAGSLLLDRHSGDSTAESNVRVSYSNESAQQNSSSNAEPLHIQAARAVSHRGSGATEFTAAPGGTVRLWQAGSQLEAATVTLDRDSRRITARGPSPGVNVHATLAQQSTATATGKVHTAASVLRVESHEMVYAEALHRIQFSGQIHLEDGTGSLRSEETTITLAAPGTQPTKQASTSTSTTNLMSGRVEQIVSSGNVELRQPGRHAAGDKLVYSAAEQSYVLTGTKAKPPVLVDDARGSVTGASLRFRSGDDSVVISGVGTSADSGRVHTETRPKE